MLEHFRDVWKVILKTKDPENAFGSDTFARHFAAHCSHLSNSWQVRKFVYENIKLLLLWKGSQISCNKSAATPRCSLCIQERRHIYHYWNKNRLGIMNSRSEIFNSCGWNTRFFQFTGGHLGTEDGVAPETVWVTSQFHNKWCNRRTGYLKADIYIHA